MVDNLDYTLNDLLEEAKNDASWEADEKLREELVELFKKSAATV